MNASLLASRNRFLRPSFLKKPNKAKEKMKKISRSMAAALFLIGLLFSSPAFAGGNDGGSVFSGSTSKAGAVAAVYQSSSPYATASGYLNPQEGFANLFNGKESTFPQVANALMLQWFTFPIAKEGTESYNRTDIVYSTVDVKSFASSKDIQSGKTMLGGTRIFGQPVNGYVVGSLQVQAQKGKANLVNYNTLRRNAECEAAKRFKGYGVCLVALPNTVAVSYGVDGRSGSFGLSPVISGLFNGGPIGAISTLAGLGLGAKTSKGITVPIAMEGQTFLVVLMDEDAPTVNVRDSYRQALRHIAQTNFPPAVSQASPEAKKLESAK